MSETTSIPQGVQRWRKVRVEPDIQAVQLLDNDDCDWDAIAAWCGGTLGSAAFGDTGEYDSYIEIPGGRWQAFAGAWIVKGTSGFQVIEDFVFSELYEVAR